MRLVWLVVSCVCLGQNAVPVEPIGAIADAFKSHSIVALGNVEFRGDEQSHAFQVALIRDPRLAAVVNDIVVEFGNARHQELMDRYIAGEDVPRETLKHVWQDTSQFEFEWDLPIYEDLFRVVRDVNAKLPATRRMRVLLGDPPVDWTHIQTIDDLIREMGDRDAHAVEVIRREVLTKKRRALVIYGGQHLLRKNPNGIVARLGDASVFVVVPETRRDLVAMQVDVASWAVPSLAMVKGTALGAALKVEDQADALLYLGPPAGMTMTKMAPALCDDPGYMEMRLRRLGLVKPPAGAKFGPADMLKKVCEK